MSKSRPRPNFLPLDYEEADARLDAKADVLGMPRIVTKKAVVAEKPVVSSGELAEAVQSVAGDGGAKSARPRPAARGGKSNTIKAHDVPDEVWLQVKIRCARERITMRSLTLMGLRAIGIQISDADLEDAGQVRVGGSVSERAV